MMYKEAEGSVWTEGETGSLSSGNESLIATFDKLNGGIAPDDQLLR